MTQNYQVTRFLSRRPPDYYLHQFSSPCSPFLQDLKRSSTNLLIPNHLALFLRIVHGGVKSVEITQNHQVTRFWSRRPPDSYLHQFSSPCSPFMWDLKRSSRPLLIPNHQALFLRIAHGGAKRVEMTQNHQVTRFWSRRPPNSYLLQFCLPYSPFFWDLKEFRDFYQFLIIRPYF